MPPCAAAATIRGLNDEYQTIAAMIVTTPQKTMPTSGSTIQSVLLVPTRSNAASGNLDASTATRMPRTSGTTANDRDQHDDQHFGAAESHAV